MRIKKKTNLIVLFLTFAAIFGFLTYAFGKTALTSDYVINSPKISAKTITITCPNSSSLWETGNNEWIYYNIIGTSGRVNISLYKDNIFEMEIDFNTWGTGAFLWINIPSDLITSNLYQIKITDCINSSVYDFSDFFEIYNPNDNSSVIPGYNLYIIIGSICIVSLIGVTCIISRLKRKKH